MSASDYFDLDLQEDGIARLTLNQPARMNTMAPDFFPAFRDAIQRLHDAGQTRVLVIASTGKHFSAGMALQTFAGQGGLLDTADARGRLSFQESLRRLMACFSVLDEARFPVICAVQGGCIGGAFDLAAACDIRLCTCLLYTSDAADD